MRSLRALWHPLTPLALVLVVLPLIIVVAAAPEARAPFMILVFLPGSLIAAWASVRALRSSLARIAVPESAPDKSYQEERLEVALRWLLVMASVIGTLAVYLAMLGVKEWQPPPPPGSDGVDFALAPYQSASLAALPLFFAIFGIQLWVHLASARRRRAQGLMPLPFQPMSATGDERLDALLRPRFRAGFVLFIIAMAGSALANLLPRSLRVIELLSKGTEGEALLQPWRFFTASFVHQELTALVVFVAAFWAVAPLVEALLGRAWLVVGAVGGGFVATLASYVFVRTNFMGLVGVDAALAGLAISSAIRARDRLSQFTLAHVAVRGLAVLVIVAFGCLLVSAADGAAAFGGFGFGTALALVARPGAPVLEALEQAHAETAAASAGEPTRA